MRLLLVEDDDRVAAAQQDVLRRHGFEVRRVGTARDALDGAHDASWVPDVVLLDLGLPDGDGFDVCAQIVSCVEHPVVIMTSSRDSSDFGPLVSTSGACGFVPKAELSGDRVQELLLL